jgi:hypothetical protein
MLQKPWFKVFIWFLSTFFFFLASAVIISMLKPGPSESEVMQFMMGMMGAMDKSLMGVSMSIKHDANLQFIIALSTMVIMPVIVISIIAGFVIRYVHRRKEDVQ